MARPNKNKSLSKTKKKVKGGIFCQDDSKFTQGNLDSFCTKQTPNDQDNKENIIPVTTEKYQVSPKSFDYEDHNEDHDDHVIYRDNCINDPATKRHKNNIGM